MLDFATSIRQHFCLLKPASRAYAHKMYRRLRFIDASDIGYRLLIRLFFRRRELFILRFRRRYWCDIFFIKRPLNPRLVRASGLLCGRRGWVDELTSLQRERFSECQRACQPHWTRRRKGYYGDKLFPLPVAGAAGCLGVAARRGRHSNILHLL